MESEATSVESQSDMPGARRLVIRVKILPKEPQREPERTRLSKSALVLISAALVVLTWVGVGMLGSGPASAPPVPSKSPKFEAQPTAAIAQAKLPAIEPKPADVKSIVPPTPPSASPTPTNEVIPNVSQSARETIRGTIRVSVRVTLDKNGAVLGATADEPGPSRYF